MKAFESVTADLLSVARALLILATGLGKTVVGGEVIARYLDGDPDLKILVTAPTKDLADQLERALWRHVPKYVRTILLSGDRRAR